MLYITEYSRSAGDGSGARIAACQEPSNAEQVVTVSGQSIQSEKFHEATTIVMVHAAEAACLAFGADPVANPERHLIGAGETRFYGVRAGHRLAVVSGA